MNKLAPLAEPLSTLAILAIREQMCRADGWIASVLGEVALACPSQ
jgi:hypothetical protein